MELNIRPRHDNNMKLHAKNKATASPCNLQLTTTPAAKFHISVDANLALSGEPFYFEKKYTGIDPR